MNTINNRFSFPRFAAVLKCDLVENRKRYISVFFIMFAAFLVYQFSEAELDDILALKDGQLQAYEKADYISRFVEGCLPFIYGVLSLALMCAAADMSAVPFKTKGCSMNYLMIPSTKLEKFLSRALINTIVVIAMTYVALLCADLVRMLCLYLLKWPLLYGFTVPRALIAWTEPLKEIYIGGASGYEIINNEIVRPRWEMSLAVMAVSFVVILCCWGHSLFILCGCIWRKRALVKMLLTAVVVTLIIVWLCMKLGPLLGSWISENIWPWIQDTFETERDVNCFTFSVGIPLFLAFIVFNWWLAYRLFSRKQAVARQHRFGGKHLHQLCPSRK